MAEIFRMTNRIQPYAWGSHTLLAELQHREPSAEPEAELWMGAHPGGPSLVYLDDHADPVPIDDFFRNDPGRFLGQAPDPDADPLRFLLKILAIAEPLSIQVHPNPDQAAAGFEREEAAGIPRNDPARNYRDRNAKPEYTVALSGLLMLNGERPQGELAQIAADLDLPWLDAITTDPVRSVLTMADGAVESALSATADAVARVGDLSGPTAEAVHAWHLASAAHPQDRGLLVALCMNLVRLEPGEGIATPSGQLHAYLTGLAVELQSASDNVLRAGLTSKHVDVPELLAVMNPTQADPVVDQPRALPDGTEDFPLWDPAISLRRARIADVLAVPVTGPAVLLATDGDHSVEVSGRFQPLRRGYSLLMTGTGVATIRGTGEVYIASMTPEV